MLTVKLNDRFNITCKGARFIAIVKKCFILVRPEDAHNTLNNGMIFDLLGVDKYEYCKKTYGYEPSMGSWPECKEEDFAALTRTLEALAREPEVFIKERVSDPKPSSPSLLKPLEDELTAVKKERAAKIAEVREHEKALELAQKQLTALTEKYNKLLDAYGIIKSIQ